MYDVCHVCVQVLACACCHAGGCVLRGGCWSSFGSCLWIGVGVGHQGTCASDLALVLLPGSEPCPAHDHPAAHALPCALSLAALRPTRHAPAHILKNLLIGALGPTKPTNVLKFSHDVCNLKAPAIQILLYDTLRSAPMLHCACTCTGSHPVFRCMYKFIYVFITILIFLIPNS